MKFFDFLLELLSLGFHVAIPFICVYVMLAFFKFNPALAPITYALVFIGIHSYRLANLEQRGRDKDL
jgi:hypothetical protein